MKPLRVGHFLAYPSRERRKTSTGQAFFGLPVEEKAENLYGSWGSRGAGRRVAHNSAAMVSAGCGGALEAGRECETGRSRGHGEREAEPRLDYLFCSATDASWMVLKMRLMKSMSMP